MKIGIYNPYFHILGGAERYVLAIARCLSKQYQIVLFCQNKDILRASEEKFGFTVENTIVKPWSQGQKERNKELSQFELFFYVTDGSIFFSPAKKNILIIQTPSHIPKKNVFNLIKLSSWQKIICYSHFMDNIIKKRLNKKTEILFVPINQVSKIQNTVKENLILSVGRFFTHLHNKKQKEMIRIFKKLIKKIPSDTRLCLVGSVDPGAKEYLASAKHEATDYPIDIKTDISYQELQKLYQKSKIYWHAAGFGEDLEKYPEKAEHFGVSTIEAMANEAVPVVFQAGGQAEIITDGQNGYTWKTEEELMSHTVNLLVNNVLRIQLAQSARISSAYYTPDIFCRKLNEILA